jgi:serine phosphatase RsbU (regulator of sigma subunit)
VTEGLNVAGVLAIEVNLDYYFYDAIHVDPGKTGQLWVFSKSGKLLFQLRNIPSFTGDIKQVLINGESAVFKAFPDPERESAVAGVSTVFGRTSQAGDNTMYIVLSRSTSEAQESVFSTLRSFGLFGVGTVIFIMVVGLLIGQFLLAETNRRRAEEQRRSTARTLLVTSRALNSSLDLNVVLQRILGELAKVLPHDSASILLLSDDKRSVTVAADTTKPDLESLENAPELSLNKLRGAREVVLTGRPVVINNTTSDPRWSAANASSSSTRAWLGVPLRVRDDSVGVLNIDSHTPDRFLPDDIDLAEAFADQAGVAIQNARAHEVELKVYEQELETARAIQTSLLPQDVPPVSNIEMAARSIPARQVSGDYYQYYMMPDGKLGVAVGDVSGKGIPAALLMAVISTALRDEILRTPSPSKLLNELNTRLQERMRQNNMNSALLMLYYDPVSREMEVSNGGMLQPYLRTNGTWENIEVGGYPLGAAARGNYSQKSVTLTPNSMVVMVSDGVVESQNLNREFFGFEGLEALLAGLSPDISADEVADCILAAVREHLQAQDPQDDITVVVMKSLP